MDVVFTIEKDLDEEKQAYLKTQEASQAKFQNKMREDKIN